MKVCSKYILLVGLSIISNWGYSAEPQFLMRELKVIPTNNAAEPTAANPSALQIQALDQSIATLRKCIELQHQQLAELQTTGNQLELSIDKSMFESSLIVIKVEIDDSVLYVSGSGLKQVSIRESYPLYRGPIKPGTHTLRVETQLANTTSRRIESLAFTIERESSRAQAQIVLAQGSKVQLQYSEQSGSGANTP